jgi:hypothetical protein
MTLVSRAPLVPHEGSWIVSHHWGLPCLIVDRLDTPASRIGGKTLRRARTAGVFASSLLVALVICGAAFADGPATSWTSSSAGQQTLNAYQTATSSQQGTVIYTTTPPTTPTPGGTPIYNYSDWTSTATTSAEYEANAAKVITWGQRIGRFLPALRVVSVIGLGYTAFDLGWRFSTGQSFWSEIFGDSASKRYDNGSGPFPQMSLVAWDYKASGVGNGFTAPGWYGRFQVTSNTSYCLGWAGTASYIVPTGTSLSQNGSDCGLRRYYSAWKLIQDNSSSVTAMGTLTSHSSPCPIFYSGGGTAGATGCQVLYRSETDMESAVRTTFPVLYTNQTAPGGTTNTGAYTRPGDQGNSSDVTASNGVLAPGTLWSSLTPQQKAAITALMHAINPNWAPIADQQTMPSCLGLSQSACNDALDNIAATGTRTYTVAGTNDADLSKPAGAVITQPIAPSTSFTRTTNLTFTKNPDPLPIVWSAPSWDETYDQYVTRLRNLGWLGQATEVDLGADNGEGDFITGGVPCTSVPTGSRLDANAGVTLYKNPSSFSGLDPSSGVVCGGPTATGLDIDTCAFPNDDVYGWRDAMNTNSFFYTMACSEAWSLVRSLFPADGSIDPADLTLFKTMMVPGANIKDADVIGYLTRNGQPMTDFEKWTTDTLDPDGSRPFQVHFYWNTVAQKVEYGDGFKVKFNQIFYP